MATETWIGGVLGLAIGVATGLLFFRLLALNTRLYARGRVAAASLLHLGRLGGTVLLLVAAARLGGAVPLIAMLAGFLAVRPLLMRRYGRA